MKRVLDLHSTAPTAPTATEFKRQKYSPRRAHESYVIPRLTQEELATVPVQEHGDAANSINQWVRDCDDNYDHESESNPRLSLGKGH